MMTEADFYADYCDVSIEKWEHPTHLKSNTTTITLDTSACGYKMIVNGLPLNKVTIVINGYYEWQAVKNAMLVQLVKEKLDA